MNKVANCPAANSLSLNCNKAKFMLSYKTPRKINVQVLSHVSEFNFLDLTMNNILTC